MTLLDIVLLVGLLAALVVGFRRGLIATLGMLLGAVAGAVVAWLVIPPINSAVPSPGWRLVVTLVLVILLPVSGAQIGSLIGHMLRSGVDVTPLRLTDRTFGALANVVVMALGLSVASAMITGAGMPHLAPAFASSKVISTINAAIPAPVERALAELREQSIPAGMAALGDLLGVGTPGEIPQVETDDPNIARAAQSVARISGVAFACGVTSTGTGFAVAPNLVVTNAHVVAGVTSPIAEFPGRRASTGEVVYYDEIDDLAGIAFDSDIAEPLTVSADLERGDEAVLVGYPHGGPLRISGAAVMSVGAADVPDVSATTSSPRQIYALAADVQPGNSGGPLLTTDGQVAGVVFAKAADIDNLGYAMTTTELLPVMVRSSDLTEPVDTGECVAR